MKNIISKTITTILKQIKSDATIYADDVMQSNKPFYIVLAIDESATDNVGVNVQNKAYLVDIALVDNVSDKESKKMVQGLTEQCGAFLNVLTIEGNEMFPEEYQAYETDGVQHISFKVAFPQLIEWSEI